MLAIDDEWCEPIADEAVVIDPFYYPILFDAVVGTDARAQVWYHITRDPLPFLQFVFVDGRLPAPDVFAADVLAMCDNVVAVDRGVVDGLRFVDLSNTDITCFVGGGRVQFALVDEIVNRGHIDGRALASADVLWFKQHLDACVLYDTYTNAVLEVPLPAYTMADDAKGAQFTAMFGCLRADDVYVFGANLPARGHFAKHAVFVRDCDFDVGNQQWTVREYRRHAPLLSGRRA